MKKRGSPGRRATRVLLLTLVLLIAGFAALVRIAYNTPSHGKSLSLDEVYQLADAGQVKQATLLDEDARLVGERCTAPRPSSPTSPPVAGVGQPPVAPIPLDPCSGAVERFQATYPSSDVSTQELIERLSDGGATVNVDQQTSTGILKLLITFVFPLLLLANLFGIIFLSRGGDSSLGEIVGFGKIGKKRQRKRRSGTGVTFADVAGADEAVAELREVVDYLSDPKRFEAYGASAPKGVLLFGPPGCGKTLLARAVAGQTGVPFFPVSGTEFVESLVGVGAARVRDLFQQIREVAPAIIFIDEIDAVGRRRSGEGQSGGEREQTLNQLLVELDGFEVTAGMVIMGATNRPDILDPALLRPGRFDRHVTLEPPDMHGRQAILQLHARNRPIAPGVDFEHLARRTPGFTGADLANVINEGALLAIRDGEGARIKSSHLAEAVMRVLHGPRRRGKLMTPEERLRIAVHEAGHAVVAAALGHREDVHRISIVARGRSLGHSLITADVEPVLLTATQVQAQLVIALSGTAAEQLVLGESSTTGQDDFVKATAMAREMVGLYGMSASLGRFCLLSRDQADEPGRSLDTVSSETMQEFDHEVRRLLTAAEATSYEVLQSRRQALDALTAQLDKEETVEGDELGRLLAQVLPHEGDLSASNGRNGGPAASTRRKRATAT